MRRVSSYTQRLIANLNEIPRHEVLLNKITHRTITKLNGDRAYKILCFAMDPTRGQYQRLHKSFLNNSDFWIRIP